GRDRRSSIRHRPRATATAASPLHAGKPELIYAQSGRQAGRIVAIVAVGGKAVDVARVDPGVLTSREDRLEAQNKFRLLRLAVTVIGRLADSGHSDLAAQTSFGHDRITTPRSDRSTERRRACGRDGGRPEQRANCGLREDRGKKQ